MKAYAHHATHFAPSLAFMLPTWRQVKQPSHGCPRHAGAAALEWVKTLLMRHGGLHTVVLVHSHLCCSTNSPHTMGSNDKQQAAAAAAAAAAPAQPSHLELLKQQAEAEMCRRAPGLLDGAQPSSKRRKTHASTHAGAAGAAGAGSESGEDEDAAAEGVVGRFAYSAVEDVCAGTTCFLGTCGFNRQRSAAKEMIQLLEPLLPGVWGAALPGRLHRAGEQQRLRQWLAAPDATAASSWPFTPCMPCAHAVACVPRARRGRAPAGGQGGVQGPGCPACCCRTTCSGGGRWAQRQR
jgi:hypothetical protein